eukprot:GHVS01056261.1.p1 GENE.GHVS01056261.1~~GHVS01056261.1.p1  ORF type:complete len:225 (-),score=1.21 GHVS01056261.1:340-1014(-)
MSHALGPCLNRTVANLCPTFPGEWYIRMSKRTAISNRVGQISRKVLYWRVNTPTTPVVLLKDVLGVGDKGDVVFVKRGYARHVLFPAGLALSGTWENIDNYAESDTLSAETQANVVVKGIGEEANPFDWIRNMVVAFHLETAHDTGLLVEPLLIWPVLQTLSERHHLDLIPENVLRFGTLEENTTWESGISTPGTHEMVVRILFQKQLKDYTIPINITPRYPRG